MPEVEREQLRQWAVKGAEQRLVEIAAEAAAIYETFPELRERGNRESASAPAAPRAGAASRRGNMNEAQRKAVSERMRRYWAARRAGAAEGDAAGGEGEGGTPAQPARGGRGRKRAAGGGNRGQRGPRKMSAAARKRISDAQKKRWADRRSKA